MHPDNYIPANPLVTPASIVPEWYLKMPLNLAICWELLITKILYSLWVSGNSLVCNNE